MRNTFFTLIILCLFCSHSLWAQSDIYDIPDGKHAKLVKVDETNGVKIYYVNVGNWDIVPYSFMKHRLRINPHVTAVKENAGTQVLKVEGTLALKESDVEQIVGEALKKLAEVLKLADSNQAFEQIIYQERDK